MTLINKLILKQKQLNTKKKENNANNTNNNYYNILQV